MICDFFDTARSHGRPVVISKLFKMHQLLMRRVARTPYSKPDIIALHRARIAAAVERFGWGKAIAA
jgi:hypothetical protein